MYEVVLQAAAQHQLHDHQVRLLHGDATQEPHDILVAADLLQRFDFRPEVQNFLVGRPI